MNPVNVLLVTPLNVPFRDINDDGPTRRKMAPQYPIGNLCIGAYAKKMVPGTIVKIIDYNTVMPRYLAKYDGYDGEPCLAGLLDDGLQSISFIPDIIGISALFSSNYFDLGVTIDYLRRRYPESIIVSGGHLASACYKEFLESFPALTAICYGEGEIPFAELVYQYKEGEAYSYLLADPSWIIRSKVVDENFKPWNMLVSNLDSIPPYDLSMLEYPDDYSNTNDDLFGLGVDNAGKDIGMFATRGCPYYCLAGNTIIHTILGDYLVKELVGKIGVKVLSRDPETQNPIYVNAVNIRKTRDNVDLVRIHFDDKSYIDCTPDHKFKVFKSKNQYIEESEWDVEAKDLKPKQQVRAVRFEINKKGRVNVSTRRDICLPRADIIYEALQNKPLQDGERIHHKDENPGNDYPDNLILTTKNKHIPDWHPKISERMKENNPTKNMTPEWGENISIANSGKKRTYEQRLKYRESKLGVNNPRYNLSSIGHGKTHHKSRVLNVNHKVISVTKLPYKEDVYCMEIPGIHWFYANKVLVHNCIFCASQFVHGHKVRKYSIDRIKQDILHYNKEYGITSFPFLDDHFLADKEMALEILNFVHDHGFVCRIYNLNYLHVDRDIIKALIKTGTDRATITIDGLNEEFLRKVVRKPANFKKAKEVIEMFREEKLPVLSNLIIGFPGETLESIDKGVKEMREMGANWYPILTATPLQGSELYEICKKNGYLPEGPERYALDYHKTWIKTPDWDSEWIQRKAYETNLYLNFVHNYDMKHGDFKTPLMFFERIINKVERNHAFAFYFAAICAKHLSREEGDQPWKYLEYRDEYYRLITKYPIWVQWIKYFNLEDL